MHLSLQTKLSDLRKYNEEAFSLESDPELHKIPGEGRLMYLGKRIEYVTDYVPPQTPKTALDRLIANLGQEMTVPHDIAWCPGESAVLATAKSEHEPFTLISEPLKADKPVPLKDRLAVSA